MDAFLICVSRWMLATLLVFGAMQQSESISFQREPDNPWDVVLGQLRVSLKWNSLLIAKPFKASTLGDRSLTTLPPSTIASRALTARSLRTTTFKDHSNYEANLNS
ncbi:hypothetical protein OS493_024237 [Desmophyllum pertusum]|uniref:Secreted protein n=1 Tax=Desmophyllum pertusum TaxID=174260 RepID=A0A9X0CS82_9CNID|nr:hypothetical protein OS493_024237 [Desmophyllum pertusum]